MKQIENGLIPIYENEEGKQLVNGRTLHDFLKVKQDFSDWIKSQLESVDATENKDFSRFPFKREGNNATLIEYALTIYIAKEISMVAGIAPRANKETKRLSKQARQYFIFIEDKYNREQKELEQKKYAELEDRVKQLEETKAIDYNKQLALQNLGKQKVINVLGGVNSPAYKDPHTRSKVFYAIWGAYKNEFAVNSYRNTSLKDFERGRHFLTTWQPSRKLKGIIQVKNEQLVIQI